MLLFLSVYSMLIQTKPILLYNIFIEEIVHEILIEQITRISL